MQKVVITGGTGFVGVSLAHHLASRGLQTILVARNTPGQKLPFDFFSWDGRTLGEWTKTLEDALAIVNLAGRSVDCIKTPDNCDLILRSRVESTQIIGKALHTLERPPATWIQMSTAHIYGDPPSEVCTEDSPTGYGLAPFVGKAWEEALLQSIPPGIREVRLRTSFVMGRNGGALQQLKKITRLGLGGKAGHGRQGISWIHEYDMNELIYQAIMDTRYSGPYIASAPHPVSNEFFMKTLRKVLRMPIGLPSPSWITRMGARFIFNTDPDLILQGRYVKSNRLTAEGFQFMFPELKEALLDLQKKE